MEVLAQRRGVPPARGRQLGVRGHDARSHHRQHQVALATGLGGDQRSKVQPLQRRRDGLHMSVRTRARHFEGLPQRHEALATQRTPDDVDQLLGQVRQVAERLVLDDARLAVAAPQQVGAIDLVLVLASRGDDVSGTGASSHARNNRAYIRRTSTTLVTTNGAKKKQPTSRLLSNDNKLGAPPSLRGGRNFGLDGPSRLDRFLGSYDMNLKPRTPQPEATEAMQRIMRLPAVLQV